MLLTWILAHHRRHLLGPMAALLALLQAPLPAGAQSPSKGPSNGYPARPVRLIVTFAPGGTVDVFARLAADKLSQRFGQQFYVENLAGATGNIGTAQAAKAAPDGHTLLMAFSSHVVNPSLFASLPYDPIKDFEPVTLAVSSTHVLTVTPSVPARTVAELVAVIRANPAKYNFASGGTGTQGHLLGEQLRLSLNLDLVHVPFNGAGPAITSVIAGHTPIGFSTLASAAAQIAGGQVRALAVTSKARSNQLPDVPTMAESGHPDVEGDIWVGVLAPAKTPTDIVSLLHREIVAMIQRPDVKERLATLGFETVGSSPQAFGRQIASEIEMWRTIIQTAKIKLQ